jgi:peptide-methionine (R)-S-oxide reductase
MLNLSDEEWKKKLTPEQYHTLREKGTEVPFTGKLLANKEDGSYHCGACGAELFKSRQKFDSGSGWPSFYDLATKGAVKLEHDAALGMERIEVKCSNCGSHLGHLFHDAPDQPTGMRYCINSNALDFKKKTEPTS